MGQYTVGSNYFMHRVIPYSADPHGITASKIAFTIMYNYRMAPNFRGAQLSQNSIFLSFAETIFMDHKDLS